MGDIYINFQTKLNEQLLKLGDIIDLSRTQIDQMAESTSPSTVTSITSMLANEVSIIDIIAFAAQ